MRALTALRSAGGPWRRLLAVLTIALVILGVVTMHAMSGSATSHGAVPVVDGPSHHAGRGAVPAALALPDQHTAGVDKASAGVCTDACGAHEMATAMCLMVLVAFLVLTAPGRRLLAWASPRSPAGPAFAAVRSRAVGAPSLHALGICRT